MKYNRDLIRFLLFISLYRNLSISAVCFVTTERGLYWVFLCFSSVLFASRLYASDLISAHSKPPFNKRLLGAHKKQDGGVQYLASRSSLASLLSFRHKLSHLDEVSGRTVDFTFLLHVTGHFSKRF